MSRHKAQEVRNASAMIAIVLALAWGDIGYTAEVFLPVKSPAPASQSTQASSHQVHQGRRVRVAHHELQRVRAEVRSFGQSHLLLNVSEHMVFDVAIERTAQTLNGYTLSGQIDGGKGGFVTLAVHPEAMAGFIWTWEQDYEIIPIGGGIHAVRQAAQDAIECDHLGQNAPVEVSEPPPSSNKASDDTIVDLLVFWTPAQERMLGDDQAMSTQIELQVAFTNDALDRSGALVSLRLVGAERLDIDSDLTTIVDALEGQHVSNRADALGADLINVTAPITEFAGVAIGRGLSVSRANPFVFAHEVGHNLCLDHDRSDILVPLLDYGGGYSVLEKANVVGRCDATIMSLGGVCSQASVP